MSMNRIYLLIAFSFLIRYGLSAQPAPKHEVRAAWITAVYGLDWPRAKATTPAGIQKQKDELVEILDKQDYLEKVGQWQMKEQNKMNFHLKSQKDSF